MLAGRHRLALGALLEAPPRRDVGTELLATGSGVFDDRESFVGDVTKGCAPATVVAERRVPSRANNVYVALRAS